MNFLILSPNQSKKYNWGHHLFRQEIGRQHNTIYYGEGFDRYNSELNVKQVINNKKIWLLFY